MNEIGQWLSYGGSRVERAIKVSAKEFVLIYKSNPAAILRSAFVAPKLGRKGFGHFRVVLNPSFSVDNTKHLVVTTEGRLEEANDPQQMSLF